MSATGYSALQIRLHWVLAILVLIQFVLHEGIVGLVELAELNKTPSLFEQWWGLSHVAIGLLIFALAIIRVIVRLKQKVPAPPASESKALQFIAKATHIALYAVLIIMPISGSAAWFAGAEQAAVGHNVGKIILLAFALLHIGGAVYQHFVLKTDVVKRMVNAEK